MQSLGVRGRFRIPTSGLPMLCLHGGQAFCRVPRKPDHQRSFPSRSRSATLPGLERFTLGPQTPHTNPTRQRGECPGHSLVRRVSVAPIRPGLEQTIRDPLSVGSSKWRGDSLFGFAPFVQVFEASAVVFKAAPEQRGGDDVRDDAHDQQGKVNRILVAEDILRHPSHDGRAEA
jgi:hypothetical protein